MATAETAGDMGAELDVEDEEFGDPELVAPPIAEVKSPNGLGNPACNPGHKAGGTRP